MIVLGVDTSLRSTGYGVVEVAGNRFRALEWGNIPNAATLPLASCIVAIFDKIDALVERWAPDVASIEKVIYAKNANSMLVLGEARGAVIAAAAKRNIEIFEYEPRRVKMSVCGNALAEKYQVQRMVKTLLALEALPQNDAADALALAICHANSVSLPVKSPSNLSRRTGARSKKGDFSRLLALGKSKGAGFDRISLEEFNAARRK